jgi:carbonic anhydrase/acetyltransferase-like protein (isoleucine patch superfamily)
MALYELEGVSPRVDPEAYVHPDAVVIGDVTIGPESTIWPGAVLRGDYGTITVGARSSIQDGTVIHAGPGFPTIVGDGCVVGHLAHLEGCILKDDSLVGSGSVVLHHAVVGSGATVGANAVVPNNMEVPPGALAIGVPAQIREGKSNLALIQMSAAEYVSNGKRFRTSLRRLDAP